MPCLHRSVLLRAAAAALALSACVGVDAAVEQALARRGEERARQDAYLCGEAARLMAQAPSRADRSLPDGRRPLDELARQNRCAPRKP
ncbi:hypothetical protein OG871_11005 [Kitasatospora sp. NBC_00374]|uniref:hypothetical protein n=1 Tax=Kitasatospora sp. NBC_00374 TaxID=2975964 RepID=UPI0030DF30EF